MIVDRIDGEHFIYLKSLQSYEKKMPDINFKYSSILFLFIKREKKKELKRNANFKSLKVIISYIDFQEI